MKMNETLKNSLAKGMTEIIMDVRNRKLSFEEIKMQALNLGKKDKRNLIKAIIDTLR
jgi:hypothetical protein